MGEELDRIRQMFESLLAAPVIAFPEIGAPDCPTAKGVYIIHNATGVVYHVGRTPSGSNGLRKRLNDHLVGGSSFARALFPEKASELRNGLASGI